MMVPTPVPNGTSVANLGEDSFTLKFSTGSRTASSITVTEMYSNVDPGENDSVPEVAV